MGIVFGPVPSRRLGMSLGVNNIPAKFCTYSCIYCQIGRTANLVVERRRFYGVEKIVDEVAEHVEEAEKRGIKIDYITFVPDGEPTLDIDLGRAAEKIRELGYRVAILTNGSLLFREDVRRDLEVFDLVSVKVDSVNARTWKRINRPHPTLSLEKILEGMKLFGESYRGTLITETMVVRGVNDNIGELKAVASFLRELKPNAAYISIPVRPPAEPWATPPDEKTLTMLFEEARRSLPNVRVELLAHPEPPSFKPLSQGPREAILSIASVHPLRREAALQLLAHYSADESVLRELVRRGEIVEVRYRGETFYLRRVLRKS